jgi:hypothetical protein
MSMDIGSICAVSLYVESRFVLWASL